MNIFNFSVKCLYRIYRTRASDRLFHPIFIKILYPIFGICKDLLLRNALSDETMPVPTGSKGHINTRSWDLQINPFSSCLVFQYIIGSDVKIPKMADLTIFGGPGPSQMVNMATCWVPQFTPFSSCSKFCEKFPFTLYNIFLYDLTKNSGP